MSNNCDTLAPEEFVLSHLSKQSIREKYLRGTFQDYVTMHPLLRYCPGLNCSVIVRCAKSQAKRVICNTCKSSYW